MTSSPKRVLAGHPVHAERRSAEGLTLVNAVPLRDARGEIVGATAIFSDVTAAAEREREERDALTLEKATRALNESLALEATLERAVATFVPDLADLCVIYSLHDGRCLRVRAAATADPVLAAATANLKHSERPVDQRLETELISGARPYIHHRVRPERIVGAAVNAPEAELGARLGPVWWTTLPLRSREGIWGIVVLISREQRANADRAELRLMQELAERAGQALENARVFALATEARERFTAAFENAPIGMALACATDGVISEANPALCAITGQTREQLVDQPLPDIYDPEQSHGGERRYLRADGHAVWLQVGVATLEGDEVVLQIQDVTDRKRYEHQLQYLADHDPLTGLFNRRRFAEELDRILAYSRRYRTPAALVAIDIDNFKFVNDTFGHATGDELLVAIAEALRARCRDSDIAGRLGGDEFGVILPQSGRQEADVVAHALLEEVRDDVSVTVGTRAVRATASIGVRLIEQDTTLTAEEILSDADIALYDAKEGGRDRMSVAGDGSAVTDRLRARIALVGPDSRRDRPRGLRALRAADPPHRDAAGPELRAAAAHARQRRHADRARRVPRHRRAIRPDPGDRPLGDRPRRQAAGRAPGGGARPRDRGQPLGRLDLRRERDRLHRRRGPQRADRPARADDRGHRDRGDRQHRARPARSRRASPISAAASRSTTSARASARSTTSSTCRSTSSRSTASSSRSSRTATPTGSPSRRSCRSRAGSPSRRSPSSSRRAATLELLTELGVDFAQGYHIGRPRPVLSDPGFTP